jgi:hypothetical protein
MIADERSQPQAQAERKQSNGRKPLAMLPATGVIAISLAWLYLHFSFKDPHYWYYSNLEDPNERGYDAVRRCFLREMATAATQLAP